ncbi:MAG TPA: alpha-L-fucosidase [Chitinophagaceae bacterium]|nr:alpha-L-fucosidase [Chitinophagaceae bacterium]
MKLRNLLALAMGMCCFVPAYAQYQADWQSLDKRQVPDWYQNAKFGIFIHWGVYSVPGYSPVGSYAEWYQHSLRSDPNGPVAKYQKEKYGDLTYYDLAKRFKAELFNPDAWAQLFQKAGAKYVVLTSKHHDGFCLWPSKEADRDWGFPWNATEVGPKQDLIKELFTALRKTDVRPGLYYSLYEWYDPLYLKDPKEFVIKHTIPQMKDLITHYKPYVLWTDGGWEQSDTTWRATQFLSWLYNDSPMKDSIVTYDRWGRGVRFHHGAVYTPEYQPGLTFNHHYFEESQGMGYSYGYNRAEDAWDYSSAQSLILELVDIVSRGGNFLLDIGPTADGKIPPIMQERLLAIGKWLSVNGDAIYGTRPWRQSVQWSAGNRHFKPKDKDSLLLKQTVAPDPGYAVKQVFFTYKGDSLFCILPRYPDNGKVVIRNLHLENGAAVTLLATQGKLSWSNDHDGVHITLPPFDPEKMSQSAAYVIRISGVPGFAATPVTTVHYGNFTADPVVSITSATSGATIHYTTDGSIPDVQSPVYQKPFSVSHNTHVKAIAFRSGLIASSMDTTLAVKHAWLNSDGVKHLKPGIHYNYYQSDTPSLSIIAKATPVKQGITSGISLKEKGRKDKFCFLFNGYIRIRKAAVYTFYLASDDGSDLWIDDIKVVDNDGDHNTAEASGKVALKKGYHKIKVRYFDSGGDNSLRVGMQAEGGKKAPLSASLLYHQP